MRAMLLTALTVALAVLAFAPAADAQPPSGAHCEVQEEYVTEASVGSGGPTSLPTVQPGARRPIECYY